MIRGLVFDFDGLILDTEVTMFQAWCELYQQRGAELTLERYALCMGRGADQAIAFEDSPNGVRAAHAAGIFTVAVPNPVTARLDLSHADLRIESFEELPLVKLLGRAGV